MKKYLRPTYMCESDSKEIKRLARRIVGKRKGREAVKAMFNWVRDKVAYDVVDVVGAKGVLKRKPMRAVCIDKANLIVALCRASGIPARYIGADIQMKIKKEIFKLKHLYAEVFYNGRWHKIDPTFGRSTSNLIKPSEFERLVNFKLISKETRYDQIPKFLPFLTKILYRLMPSVVRFKKTIGGG